MRYNWFDGIRTTLDEASVQAIYQDDQMSGYTIYGNNFRDCDCGVFIGGGREHNVFDNRFDHVDLAIHIDNRGMVVPSHHKSCERGGKFEQELLSYNYQQPPWSVHYPSLVGIMDDHPCVPVHNAIYNNQYCGGNFTDVSASEASVWLDVFTNNSISQDC